ncbi:MAG: DNA mismatch repair protein MutS, partial [Kiritimatiellae bacterium]|nr:DNA mismatch repair protein MutS [Kiritimatiellia bacterium]
MASKPDELTPMMRQYRRIRSELPEDTLLLFRLGDFYEMFFDDAKTAAPILGVALTRRAGVPMCGVPYHALDSYLAKLVRAGRQAAICEPVEDPALAKGIVRREVARVVTPGTVIEDTILDAARNNYLAAIHEAETGLFGLALLDLSTGDFSVEEVRGGDALRDHLRRYAPSECLVGAEQREHGDLGGILRAATLPAVTAIESWTLQQDSARQELLRHFRVHSLDGFGCEHLPALIGAAGALLHHVREELRRPVSHVRALHVRQAGDCLLLDESTCANLDLIPLRGRAPENTLLGVLDNTRTPMGARLLRAWLLRPLSSLAAIGRRHEAVACFCGTRTALTAFREALGEIRDLERLIARIGSGQGNARDLRALATSLQAMPAIQETLRAVSDGLVQELAGQMQPLPELAGELLRGLVEAPPIGLKDGGMIQPGYNAQLDELRQMAGDGHAWLARYQAQEQERTGIKTLKVRHNKVFGFYIEVSKGQSDNVPANYERRQTLVGAERFITPELKDYEQRIFGAQDRSRALEYEIFCALRDRASAQTAAIQETAAALAGLDALASLADRALALGYTRPEMHEGDELIIREGRHPVIEQLPDAERF